MRLLRALAVLGASLLVACPGKGPPLDKAECRKLLLRQHEVLTSDLRGEDLSASEVSFAASFDVEVKDCVQGRSWSRRGFDCIMAAQTQEEMRFCIHRN
jgi:hypothetical protein